LDRVRAETGVDLYHVLSAEQVVVAIEFLERIRK
jgi:hypothetical protein